MAGESVTFDFLSQGADTLQRDFKGVGDNAALAAKGARLCSDALAAQRKAADTSAGATLALAKADRILADAEEELSGRAAEADLALRAQADAAKKAAAESAAASAAAKEAGGGFSALATPMGAAVAAGVALSPVLVTLGAGLGGLGLAALSVAKNQQLMAAELAPLKDQYAQFTKSLQPTVLADFSGGLQIAGHLLRDVQPVAQATGKALSVMLGQVDKEFQSGTWKQFFTFMATTAGPDMQLLTGNFTGLLGVLPPLLEDLQPLATGFLQTSDNAIKLAGAVADLGKSTNQTSQSVGTNTGALGFLSKAVENVTSFMKPGGVAAGALSEALGGIPGTAGKAGSATAAMGADAQAAAQHVQSLATQVTGLTNAESKALTPLLSYTNAVLQQKNDAATLATALKASGDVIGTNTAAQRASFSAANTYIQDLVNTAAAADKSHQNIGAVTSSLENALPQLQNARGGTRAYWQEVQTLVNWLQKLQQLKTINEKVNITGSGQWAFVQGGGQNTRLTAGAARGLYIASGRPGVDDQLIRAQRGELIVPTPIVASGAVDHLRGRIPGFATGGIVGSYSGALGGLQPWADANWQSTVSQIGTGIASAMAQQVKAATAAQLGSNSGPAGGDATANKALARSMFPFPASQWASFDYVEMREAGYNRFARNPSSGAYGIPQALPESKLPPAGRASGGSHAGPQLSWMFDYIKSRYGNPAGAAAHERSFSWYDAGGILSPGLTLAVNGTGRPEHVIPGEGIAGMLSQLTAILATLQQLTSVVSGGSILGGPGVAAAAGGGFGLTRSDLGLPPPATTTADTSAADTSGSDATSASSAAPAKPKKPAGPNPAQKSAIGVLEHLMGGYITHNQLAAAHQANALLDWLGVPKYNSQVSQIGRLDNLLAGYRKAKNTAAVKATETLLGKLGVHSFTPVTTAKGNASKTAVTAALTTLMHADIAANNLTSAKQANSLLTHLGDSKFTTDLSQIAYFDALLAKYKKAKDSKDVKATETLLRTYGVKKFAAGGWITEPVTGIGASGQVYQFGEAGRPELVVPSSSRGGGGGGQNALVAELQALRSELRNLTSVAAAAPAATGRHVAAGVNGAAADAVFRGRYPGR